MTAPLPPEWIVSRDEHNVRLDLFLASPDRLGSRSRVRQAIDRGKVFVNEAEVVSRQAGLRVREGDVVRLWVDRPGSARRRAAFDLGPLQILYEDELLIVVNKPPGLLTVPLGRRREQGSVYDLLLRARPRHLGGRSHGPRVVHRIDRDTSGLVVFAKTAQAQERLKGQFARREPERVYRAMVVGCPTPRKGQWRDRLAWDSETLRQRATDGRHSKGAEAISEYEVLETFGHASLIEVRLVTGKRNQIRIQAALRGHQLLGERQYLTEGGRGKAEGGRAAAFPRQALHAYRLVLRHPVDNRRLEFEAPLPRDLSELLTRLRSGRLT